ncbi:hypothetical protein D2962_08060 [Biomaibacter acetigenes]|uniref:Uncharacterized protein n=1 Tax=Biomaibacter acetigenes TaxID=2316383 RepID=A0A3G2R5C1_9FIRM|nr:hypothetical protein [Biomaibacter acetigenes]AYO30579.1 hypothetical protein D2962_08060 [Biomaibacter acetigenes]
MKNMQNKPEDMKQKLREIRLEKIIVLKSLWYNRFLGYGSALLLLFSAFCVLVFWINNFKGKHIPLNFLDVVKNYTISITLTIINWSYFGLIWHCGHLLEKEHRFLEVDKELCEKLKSLKNEESIYKILLRGAERKNNLQN